MGHQRPGRHGTLKTLHNIMGQHLQWIAPGMKSPSQNPIQPPDPSIPPAGKIDIGIVGPVNGVKSNRHALIVRWNQVYAANEKRMLPIRLIFNLMMPWQQRPIPRKKDHLFSIDPQPTPPQPAPQQHPAFDPRARRPFRRRELIPVGQDDDRGAFDGFIHVLSTASHVQRLA